VETPLAAGPPRDHYLWDLFMRQPVKQIAYIYCINFAKTEFLYPISFENIKQR